MSAERGRYSKVSRRVWNDASFRGLSQPKPCGSWLFFRLLTGPELTNIPGLFQAWEMGLAQALGWSVKDFRKAFGEVARQGLVRADWNLGLIWLPKAVHHNEPESPNVVASWKTAWEELPDCSLRTEAWSSLKAWCESKGEAWAKAFEKATGKPSDNPSPNQKQEQKQEQEQKQKPPSPPDGFPMRPDWRPSPEVVASFRVAMIPDWAIDQLIARHRSHFVGKKAEIRTQEGWDESCSKWVYGDWSNPQKRPKRPESEPENGGWGGDEGFVT